MVGLEVGGRFGSVPVAAGANRAPGRQVGLSRASGGCRRRAARRRHSPTHRLQMNNSGMDNLQMESNGSFLDVMNVGFGDMDFATSLFYNLYILDTCRGNIKTSKRSKRRDSGIY